MQRLMRLAVRQIDWMPDGEHQVHFRHFANPAHLSGEKAGREWFHTMVHNGSPLHRSLQPLIFRVQHTLHLQGQTKRGTARIWRIVANASLPGAIETVAGMSVSLPRGMFAKVKGCV
jgi:hypothetical protein